MEDEEYRMQIACKQVYTILSLYNRELLCLILPEEVLRKLKENSAKDYEYNINPNTFSPDDITEEASAILLIIFDKYFANQTQKDKINRFLNTQDNENFDYNLLFKNKDIMLNYNVVTKCTYMLKENDIFSIRKFGKYKYVGIINNTKKGNYIIKYLKYI